MQADANANSPPTSGGQTDAVPSSRSVNSRRLASRTALSLLIGFLIVQSLLIVTGVWNSTRPQLALATFRSDLALRTWAAEFFWLAVTDLARFGLIGLLLGLSVTADRGLLDRLAKQTVLMCWGLVLAAGLIVLDRHRVPHWQEVAWAALGLVAGVWLGGGLRNGRRGLLRLAVEATVVAIAAAALAWRLDREVWAEKTNTGRPVAVTSSEQRRLIEAIAAQVERQARRVGVDQTITIRLDPEQSNRALTLISRGQVPGWRWQVRLVENRWKFEASFQKETKPPQFLNLVWVGEVRLEAGRLQTRTSECRMGNLRIPPDWLSGFERVLQSELDEQPGWANVLSAIDEMSVDDGRLSVRGRPVELRNAVLPLLGAGLSTSQQQLLSTRAQVRHLMSVAEKLPEGEGRFVGLVREALLLAQRRADGADPVVENRAAILALAYLIGDRRVDWLTGPLLDERMESEIGKRLGPVTIRGRSDHPRHFVLSGGLAVISDSWVSDALGRLKEQWDSQDGSGYSFSDLLADEAGRRFAEIATRDANSARWLQRQMVRDFALEDLFPPTACLPDGLSEAEFQRRFGSGDEYQQIEREISQRLNQSRLLNPSRQ